MSTVQPPPPNTPIPSPTGHTAATAVVVKATPALHTLPVGQAVKATVASIPTANQIQVHTDLGPATLQTGLNVPKGAVLTLVLTSLKPPVFQIGLVDGKPVPGALTSAQAKTAGILPQTTQGGAELQTLKPGTQLGAVLLRPAHAAPQSAPQSFQAGSPVQANPNTLGNAQVQGQNTAAQSLASTNLKGSAQSAQTAQAATAKPTQGSMAQGSSLPATAVLAKASSATGPTLLPSGTRLSVSVVRIDSPSTVLSTQPSAAPKGIAQGQTVIGTVIGRSPHGQPIVQTSVATLSLDTKAMLTDGAKVTLRFETTPTPAEPSSASQRLGRAGMGMDMVNAKNWGDFSDALKTLASLDPSRFQNVIQTALPQPGAKLNNQMLFFLSALKGGDLKNLFGETATRLLNKDRPNLMSRLGGDFQAMSAMADEPQSGDWRLSLVPLWTGQQLEQLRLYHRGGGGQDDENGEDEGTRFVLDVELSNLGHMQIDGLMKSSKSRLDLILRTEQPLPDVMRADIQDIAEAAEDVLGLSTAITFQARPEDFVVFPPNGSPEQGLLA